jgi:hypothetical protein
MCGKLKGIAQPKEIERSTANVFIEKISCFVVKRNEKKKAERGEVQKKITQNNSETRERKKIPHSVKKKVFQG